MKKILLVCSAGMSTSLMVTKMQTEADARGIETKIWAVADAKAQTEVEEADCVLLGPQVRFLLSKIQGFAGDKPVAVIDMAAYGMMDGKKVLDQALALLG